MPVPAARRALLGALPLLAAGCSGADLANALTPRGGFERHRDVAYGPDQRHRLDLYLPHRMAADAPTVIFIHGGNWETGSKDLYVFVGAALAGRGYAVVIPNYRQYPAVRYPTFLEDGALATAWVARAGTGAGLPGGPLVMSGHSAGAYNAAMLALDPRWLGAVGTPPPAAFVGLSGPYDFLPLDSDMLRDLFNATRDPAGLPATQPIAHAAGPKPPLLLITGTADTTVRPGNSERLAAARRAAGGTAELIEYPGVGHIGTVSPFAAVVRPFGAPVLRDVARFVDGLRGARSAAGA